MMKSLTTAAEQTPQLAIFLAAGNKASWREEYVEHHHEVDEGPPKLGVEELLHKIEESHQPTRRSRSRACVTGTSLLLMNSFENDASPSALREASHR